MCHVFPIWFPFRVHQWGLYSLSKLRICRHMNFKGFSCIGFVSSGDVWDLVKPGFSGVRYTLAQKLWLGKGPTLPRVFSVENWLCIFSFVGEYSTQIRTSHLAHLGFAGVQWIMCQRKSFLGKHEASLGWANLLLKIRNKANILFKSDLRAVNNQLIR